MGDLAVYGGTWEPLRNHEHWDWTSLKGAWDKAPTVKEICKLGDIAYFGKLSKSGETRLFWGLATPGSTSTGSF